MFNDANEYLNKLIEVHDRSRLSCRQVAWECDLDPQICPRPERRPRWESKTAHSGGIEWRG